MGRGQADNSHGADAFSFSRQPLRSSRVAAAALGALGQVENLLDGDLSAVLACWAALQVKDLVGDGSLTESSWRDTLYPLLETAAGREAWTSAEAEAAYSASREAEGERLDLHYHKSVAERLLGTPQEPDFDLVGRSWALHTAVLATWAMVLPPEQQTLRRRTVESAFRAACLALAMQDQPRLRGFIDQAGVNAMIEQIFGGQFESATLLEHDPELAGFDSWEEWEREVELSIADERVVEVNTLIELLTRCKFADLDTVLPLAAKGAIEARKLIVLPEQWQETLNPLLERLATGQKVTFTDSEWRKTLEAVVSAERTAEALRQDFAAGYATMAMDSATLAVVRVCQAALYAASDPSSSEACSSCKETLYLIGSALVEARDEQGLSRYMQLLAA